MPLIAHCGSNFDMGPSCPSQLRHVGTSAPRPASSECEARPLSLYMRNDARRRSTPRGEKFPDAQRQAFRVG